MASALWTKLFGRIFGYTEDEEYSFLEKKAKLTILLILMYILGLLCYLLGIEIIAGVLGGIFTFGIVIILAFVWGKPALQKFAGITSLSALFSNNVIVGMVLFLFYIMIAYFSGMILAVFGCFRFIYLYIKRNGGINKIISSVKNRINNKTKLSNSKDRIAIGDIYEKRDTDPLSVLKKKYGDEKGTLIFNKANEGDIKAKLIFANCLRDEGETSQAFELYKELAAAGNSQAMYELTDYYEGQYFEVEADPIKAKECRMEALKQNNVDMIVKIGREYYEGKKVMQDKEKALKYFSKAAKLGSLKAYAFIGDYYYNGEVVGQNYETAIKCYLKAKENGHACYTLGLCFMEGRGTAKDYEKAVICFERACSRKTSMYGKEYNSAIQYLCTLYKNGYGGSDAKEKYNKIKTQQARIRDLADMIQSE